MKILNQYRGLRREIYILFFGRIVTNLGSMVWPIMTLLLNQKLGFSAAEISYFFIGSGLVMLPAGLLGGKLADRFNKKWLIVICDSVSIVCSVACAVIPLGLLTVVLFVLAGTFQSVEYPAYDALFADLSLTKDRERAYSLEYLGGNLGLVLSPTIAGLLFKDYLWLSFLISGVAIALSTILIAVLIRDVTPVEDKSEEAAYQENKEGAGLVAILKQNPLVLLYILCSAFYFAAYGQYNFIMPLDMAAKHGDAGAVIYGTVSSLNCIIVVLCTPIITRLFVKLRDTGKILVGRLLVFGGYLIFLLSLGFIPAYYICMIVFTWGEIFSTIAEGPYVSTRIPASHRGRINGVMTVLCTMIGAAVDLGVGQIYASERGGSTPTWVMILAVMLVSMLFAGVLLARDKKAYPQLYKAKKAEETPDDVPEKTE